MKEEYFIVSGSSTYRVEACYLSKEHAMRDCRDYANNNPNSKFRVVKTIAVPEVKITVNMIEQ